MTGGGPGTATEPIALYTFTSLLQNLRFGYGSALSVLVFLVAFLLALGLHPGGGRRSHRRAAVSRGAAGPRWRVGLLVLATAFPFYWTVVASLTPEARLFQAPSLLPTRPGAGPLSRPVRGAGLLGADPQLAGRRRVHHGVQRDGGLALRVRAGPTALSGQGPAARPGARGEHVSADLGRVAALPAAAEPAADRHLPRTDPALSDLRAAAHGVAAGRVLPAAPGGARGGGHGGRRRPAARVSRGDRARWPCPAWRPPRS